jgi:thioredoxin reductase
VTNNVKKQDIVVIGAGPYGLSVAAHLRGRGVEPYVLGQPMAFWKDNMPAGMLLRSAVEASNIDAPQKALSIYKFEKSIGRRLANPLPIEDFIAFGEWFQKQAAPGLDQRMVKTVSRTSAGLEVTLEDGERIASRAVVLAMGIGLFKYRPVEFVPLPCELAPHSSDFRDMAMFRGRRVAIVGKGQSALEYAALMHENGAEVDVITRAPAIAFRPFPWRKHLFRQLTGWGPCTPLSHMVFPPTDLGDIRTARMMANPDSFRRQSPDVQDRLLKDCARPVGAYWLPARLQHVRVRANLTTARAEVAGRRVRLTFNDGTTEVYDRVVLATGYRIDVSKYHVLDVALRRELQRTSDGYPVLSTGLETSVEGLYMAGVVGEKTLGPTLRFVTGTSNAGPRLAAAAARRLGKLAR